MNRLRAGSVGVAVGLIGLAGVVAVAPEVLGPLVPGLRRTLGPGAINSTQTLLLLGLVAAFASVLVARGTGPTDQAGPGIRAGHGGIESIPAGAEFDRRLAALQDAPGPRDDLVDSLRRDLRETAITVLSRSESWTQDDVRSRLDRGTWTDDPQAAAFFAGTEPPMGVRVREWLRAPPAVEQRIARVIDDLEARRGLGGPADAGTDDSGATADGAATDLDSESSTEGATGTGARGASPAERGQASTTDPAETSGASREQRSTAGIGVTTHRIDQADRPGVVDRTVEGTARHPAATADAPLAEASDLVAGRTGGVSLGLLALGIGLATSTTAPFLLGLVAIGHTVWNYVADAPPPTVELTRTVGADEVVPGDRVEVELAVENVGDRPLSDLRVHGAPPEALRIVSGSPGMFTSLQPGGTDTIAYTVETKRGTFTFDGPTVATRSATGVRERSAVVPLSTRLACSTGLVDLPLAVQTSSRIGAVKTDDAGSGIEFYGTREYRAGDPLARVDWNHLAKTGTLTTVEFREQRAPVVSIVLDQREAARVAGSAADLDGVDLCVYAAEQAFLLLLEAGTEVGLITYGEELTDIEPSDEPGQRALIQAQLRAATDRYAAALGESTVDPAGTVLRRPEPDVSTLEYHVPRNAQVLVLSPATDGFALEATERLRADGFPVTLLSPAVVGDETPGGRRRSLERACRLGAVRDAGARVVDWAPAEPLQLALSRATALYDNP